METIASIQQRYARDNMTSPSTNFDFYLSSDGFDVVSASPEGVNILFSSTLQSSIYVGLKLPSKELAIALGRALLSVGEGCLNEAKGTF